MLLAPYLSYFTIRYCSNVFLNAQLEDLKISDHGKVLSYLILSLESFKNFFKPLQQRMDYVFIVLKQDSSKAIAKFLAQFNEKDRKKIIVIVAIKPRIDASSNNKLPAERRNV
jgi:vacuolar-type H+-ATPase subunit F/Vma7